MNWNRMEKLGISQYLQALFHFARNSFNPPIWPKRAQKSAYGIRWRYQILVVMS